MAKYRLVCPDCGQSEFTRIYQGITLFEGIESIFFDDDDEFNTTFSIERQVHQTTKGCVKCDYCEFMIELEFKDGEEDTDKRFMELLIKEGCAVEEVSEDAYK